MTNSLDTAVVSVIFRLTILVSDGVCKYNNECKYNNSIKINSLTFPFSV